MAFILTSLYRKALGIPGPLWGGFTGEFQRSLVDSHCKGVVMRSFEVLFVYILPCNLTILFVIVPCGNNSVSARVYGMPIRAFRHKRRNNALVAMLSLGKQGNCFGHNLTSAYWFTYHWVVLLWEEKLDTTMKAMGYQPPDLVWKLFDYSHAICVSHNMI